MQSDYSRQFKFRDFLVYQEVKLLNIQIKRVSKKKIPIVCHLFNATDSLSNVKGQLSSVQGGFSLIETLLAIGLFVLLSVAFIGAMVYGREGAMTSGTRMRATYLADEALEVARNIRDENFENLVAGTYGLAIQGGQWEIQESPDVTDGFTRQVTVSDVDDETKLIGSIVTWSQTAQRPGQVTISTYLTSWHSGGGGGGSCASYCQELAYRSGICRQNEQQCSNNGETHESGGDAFCTGGPSEDTCCCQR